jgi:hypothetical protein
MKPIRLLPCLIVFPKSASLKSPLMILKSKKMITEVKAESLKYTVKLVSLNSTYLKRYKSKTRGIAAQQWVKSEFDKYA